jgi:N-dimethylarginine dimethylaminohydrolase
MMVLNVIDETSSLESLVVGIANSNGGIPELKDVYDPKSRSHILSRTYPLEADMIIELDCFISKLISYGIKVYRPDLIKNYNQIYSRDIGFVIENKFFKSNILPIRSREIDALKNILNSLDPELIITFPKDAHIEGGDVVLHKDKIYVGAYIRSDYPKYITARTNLEGLKFLQNYFSNKEVVLLELNKSNTDPKKNVLHLDCCFQPIGKTSAIIHKGGFSNKNQLLALIDDFGIENCFFINSNEMFDMMSNVFSINNNTVVSDSSFTRLNKWLIEKSFKVEEVSFREIAKQEGLFRCVTLPLIRKNE